MYDIWTPWHFYVQPWRKEKKKINIMSDIKDVIIIEVYQAIIGMNHT